MKHKSVFFKIALCLILAGSVSTAFAQKDTDVQFIPLTYKDYISKVFNKNFDYASQKYEVDIAKARIEAAKIVPDPAISIGWAGNRESISANGFSVSTEVSKTFELGNKRKARIDLAKNEHQQAELGLRNFFANLQADATLDYLSALKQNKLYEVALDSYKTMKKLADADSIRFELGSIKEIDAEQSKIEAGIIQNSISQSNADRRQTLLQLSNRISSYSRDSLLQPDGKLEKPERLYAVDELIKSALTTRPEILLSELNVKHSEKQLTLTRKNRITDIDLKIGASNAYSGKGVYSASGSEISAGIGIPLKFSNLNKSELRIANDQVKQSELQRKQCEITVKNDVEQRFYQYRSLCRQVDAYKNGLLEKAKNVLSGKIYSYSRGDTSLLEVLNAQRTYNDQQTAYYETLFNCYAALVELQRAVGTWDIEL